MMETKLNLKGNTIAKWFFSIALMLGLFCTTNIHAQLTAIERQHTNQLTITRAQFLAMDIPAEKAFLQTPGFIITDIKNAQPDNYLHGPADGQFYITEWDFYHSILDKQMEILHKPDIYIVFPDASHN